MVAVGAGFAVWAQVVFFVTREQKCGCRFFRKGAGFLEFAQIPIVALFERNRHSNIGRHRPRGIVE